MGMTSCGVASLRISSQLPKAFRILPVGRFRAHDGRQDGEWVLPAERGRQIAALAGQKAGGFLIDYEHESLKRQDAAEAGRIHALEWRDDGLYATDASWSDEAKQMIVTDKKRFISPVFRYDSVTKEVLGLESIALTSDPALLGLTDLSQVAVATAQKQQPGAAAEYLSDRSREAFEHSFGITPEAAAAQWQQEQAALTSQPESGMSAQDRANFEHVFGATSESLADRLSDKTSPPPEGTSAEDWAKFRHVFGSDFRGS